MSPAPPDLTPLLYLVFAAGLLAGLMVGFMFGWSR